MSFDWGAAMAQHVRTWLGIVVAIALHSPAAGAAGSEAKALKTSHASAVQRVKVVKIIEAKMAQKPKSKVAAASKKNVTKYKNQTMHHGPSSEELRFRLQAIIRNLHPLLTAAQTRPPNCRV
jgi:hypothetical protein